MTLLPLNIRRGAQLSLLAFILSAPAYAQSTPTLEDMWEIIQKQAAEIEALKSEIKKQKAVKPQSNAPVTATPGAAPTRTSRLPRAGSANRAQPRPADPSIETLAEDDDFRPIGSTERGFGAGGLGRFDNAGYGRFGDTVVGGYGEFLYNRTNSDTASRQSELDVQRFVLYVGHEFNDRIRVFSELELEHTFLQDTPTGETPGQFTIEQAFVQLDITEQTRLNAGLVLLPLGILNEIHEPTTFFGVERNQVESQIIPTTFREGGIGLQGAIGATGISYDALFHTGLNVLGVSASGGNDNSDVISLTGSSPFDIRSSRTQVARTQPRDPALTGRLKYTAIPGLEVAGSLSYNFDITQSTPIDTVGDGVGDTIEQVEALLSTVHVDYLYKGFGLRALYARWDLGGDLPELSGEDRQRGFYIEPSYRFDLPGSFGLIDDFGTLGVFYRFEDVDEHAGANETQSQFDDGYNRNSFGINYWPHPGVVFKGDVQFESRENGDDNTLFNLGIGFSF